MNDEQLIKLLKDNFPDRADHDQLVAALAELHTAMNHRFNIVSERFDDVDESLRDLKASARALDEVLEAHPLPRIKRLEQRAGFPPYIPTLAEE